ncbi:3-mercaptopyruvate sulfurtransferase [Methylocapsa acidiphila]|uniref:3-mercaptopyruvate sulfurtransferase n=1 Tax=Methylocapsa acidiphila TaxID=133552 RepID=UPI00040C6084|nr:3-mercaptopyruvate sulfurtransferase [Methylocapsa acidiphila]
MSASAGNSLFVSTAWLAENLDAPDLAIVDGTFFMPDENRDARREYLAGHIPGAVFFDIDEIADHSTALPHMLPSVDVFAAAMEALGLGNDQRFVVYDATGLPGAARVWWTLRVFGARDVKLLSGGLPQWRAEGRPLETGAPSRAPRAFAAHLDAVAVLDAAKVKAASESGSAQIVDARAAARFKGAVPEPRAGLRSGHIPGSRNLPWREIAADGAIKPADEVKAAFVAAGVDLTRPIITTCGSGVTAAVLLLALETIGKTGVALYDGSWSEWGGRDDLPIAIGD